MNGSAVKELVIYHCFGGAHSSVTSAAIYLDLLPRDRVPETVEILRTPHYDGDETIVHGHFRFMGRDEEDRAVFVLGKRMLGPGVSRLLIMFAGIYGCAGDIFARDTTAPINLLMICGGYLSRALKFVALGRPLVVLGTKHAYFRFVRIAEQCANRLKLSCRVADARQAPGRRAIFYICPEGFRLAMVTACLHVRPGASDPEILNWANKSAFSGEVGQVLLMGVADHYRVYLVGGGREPLIVGRMIRELRSLLGLPQQSCLVYDQVANPSWPQLMTARLCRRLRLSGLFKACEQRALLAMTGFCRQESLGIKKRIREGILE